MPAIGLGGGFVTPATTAARWARSKKVVRGMAAGVLNSARQTGSALASRSSLLLAARHSFDAGMRAVLWTAAALAWWRALETTHGHAHARNVWRVAITMAGADHHRAGGAIDIRLRGRRRKHAANHAGHQTNPTTTISITPTMIRTE